MPRHSKSKTLRRSKAQASQGSGKVSLPDLFVERLEYDPRQEEVPRRLVNAAYWLAEEFAQVPSERPGTRRACDHTSEYSTGFKRQSFLSAAMHCRRPVPCR